MLEICFKALALANIGRELDDLVRTTVQIEDRIVGRLQPDLPAAFPNASIFRGLVQASAQVGPKNLVVGGLSVAWFHEQAMVPALHLGERIAEHVQELVVRRDDGSVQFELDDAHRLVDRGNLPGMVGRQELLPGDVGREFDDLGRHHRLFVDPSDGQSAHYQEFWASLRAGHYQEAEYRRIGKYGREVWLQATYNPILDLNGHPYKIVKFAADVTERKLLRNLSITDSLTGLYNRRHADDVLRIEIARARRSHTPLTIALFDLDHFKKINDAFGHGCGDDVLKATAATFLSALREGDIVARYGGEEFLTVLPVTTLHEAATTLSRVKDYMASQIVPGLPYPVTISAGIVRYREGETVAQCLSRADQLLYKAKSDGRDRLIFSDDREREF